VARVVARETAVSDAGVAFSYGREGDASITVARGGTRVRLLVLERHLPRFPRSLLLTNMRAAWLLPTSGGAAVYRTDQFAGSWTTWHPKVHRANRLLPAGTTSIALWGNDIGWYTDPTGINRVSSDLFPH
jgi:hypothetical protein